MTYSPATQFSIEFELVRLCCAAAIAPHLPDHLEAIHALLAGPIHWSDVLRVLDRHKVQGLAYRVLEDREEVPPAIRQKLSESARKVAQQNIFGAAHAARLCKVLEGEGIPVAVLKGLPLCMKAYGDLSIRHSKDIDLLVAPGYVDRTVDQLEAMGYTRLTPHSGLSEKQETLWRFHKKDYAFRHPLTGTEVELHWRLFDNVHLLPERFPFAPLQRIEVSRGVSLPSLSDVEFLLYLCVHGAQHAWFRLKWVADIAALASQLSPQQLNDLMKLGEEMGVAQTVRLALLHSTMLFGTPHESMLRPATPFEHSLMKISTRVLLRGNGMDEPKDVPFGLTWISVFQFLLKPTTNYWREEAYRWMISGQWDPASAKGEPSTTSVFLLVPRWIWRHVSLRKSIAGPPV